MSDEHVVRVTIGGARLELTGYRHEPAVIEVRPSDCVRTVTRADGSTVYAPDPEGLEATIRRQVNAALIAAAGVPASLLVGQSPGGFSTDDDCRGQQR